MFKKINQKKIQTIKQQGFSLVEVLFALLVFAIGITSILFIMVRNIRNSIEARDQIVAAELVQEGLELVRNLNDNLQLTVGANYPNFRVDASNTIISFTDAGTNWRLFNNNGAYSHNTAGTVTKFARRIDVVDGEAGQRTIISMVAWDNTGEIPPVCNITTHCASARAVVSYQFQIVQRN